MGSWLQRGWSNWGMAAGLVLPLLLGGCSLLRPTPRLEAIKAEPVQMPALATPTDDQFALGVLADPPGLMERAKAWQKELGLDLPLDDADMRELQDTLQAGQPLAGVVWAAGLFQSPAISIVGAPRDPQDQKFAGAIDLGEGLRMTTEQGAPPASFKREALRGQITGARATDASAQINIDALWKLYGSMLRSQVQALPSMLRGNGASLPPGTLALLQGEAQLLLDGLEQTKSVGLHASLLPGGLDTGLLLTPKAGSHLAASLPADPATAPNLLPYLPAGSLLRVQMSITDAQRFAADYSELLGTLYGLDLSSGTLRADLAEMGDMGAFHWAQDAGFTADGQLVTRMLFTCEHPAAFIKLLDQTAPRMLNAGPLHEAYLRMGQTIDFKPLEGKRSVKGWPVRSYQMRLEPTAEIPAPQAELLRRMLGKDGLRYEVVQMGKLFVISLGEPVDASLDRVLEQRTAPLVAGASYPAGAVCFGEFNPSGLAPFLAVVSQQTGGQTPPNLTPLAGAPPISFAAYHREGQAWWRLFMPRELIARFPAMAQANP